MSVEVDVFAQHTKCTERAIVDCRNFHTSCYHIIWQAKHITWQAGNQDRHDISDIKMVLIIYAVLVSFVGWSFGQEHLETEISEKGELPVSFHFNLGLL